MERERLGWLDIAKGIAIILVVMGHVTSNYGSDKSLDISTSFRVLHSFIYSFHIPLFMFISGYLFSSDIMKNCKTIAINKLISYGIPYIVFSVAYWIAKTLGSVFVNNSVSVKDISLILFFPLSFMWYLYALLLMVEVTIFIVNRTEKLGMVLWIAIVCRLIWEILSVVSWNVNSRINDLILFDFIKNYIWFAIALVYAKKLFDTVKRIPNHVKGIVAGMMFLGLGVVAWNEITLVPFIRILWALMGIIAVIILSMLIWQNRLLEYFGRSTLQIYLIHGTIISVAKVAFTRVNLPLYGGYGPLLYCTVISILISLAVYGVCKKIPFLDFCFFPNRYIKYGKVAGDLKCRKD